MKYARNVYRKAEQRGMMFDARTYLELRNEGAPADYAWLWANRAYRGVRKAYRHRA